MNEWIKAARQSASMTQLELADAMRVTKANVSAWENARHDASHEQLLRIAQVTRTAAPLPGSDLGMPTQQRKWVFEGISEDKFFSLDKQNASRLEGAILLAAAQLDIDLKK